MDKPTAFTKDMVLAMLRRLKGQTMRVMNPQPDGRFKYVRKHSVYPDYFQWLTDLRRGLGHEQNIKPKHKVGDRLLVQEGYQIIRGVKCSIHNLYKLKGNYLADDDLFDVMVTKQEYEKWKARKFPYRPLASRFMYKSLCRISVPITKITVQRPQDLTEDECIAEGIYETGREVRQAGRLVMEYPSYEKGVRCTSAVASFSTLWNSLHKDGWEKNEWCFCYHWNPDEIEIKE